MKYGIKLFRLYSVFTPLIFSFLLIVAISGSQEVVAQEMDKTNSLSAPGVELTGSDPGSKVSDELCSISAVKRYLTNHISYPEGAVEEGHVGEVELYARINSQGGINEVLELQPVSDYIDVDEVVITEYAPQGQEILKSSRHESLISEAHRVIMSLPGLDIPEVYGQTLKFTFKFVLK